MSNQPNKTNGAKPAVRKKKNLLDDRRVRLRFSHISIFSNGRKILISFSSS